MKLRVAMAVGLCLTVLGGCKNESRSESQVAADIQDGAPGTPGGPGRYGEDREDPPPVVGTTSGTEKNGELYNFGTCLVLARPTAGEGLDLALMLDSVLTTTISGNSAKFNPERCLFASACLLLTTTARCPINCELHLEKAPGAFTFAPRYAGVDRGFCATFTASVAMVAGPAMGTGTKEPFFENEEFDLR